MLKVLQLNDGNFIEDIELNGRIIMCPTALQAKKFWKEIDLKVYTNYLDQNYGKRLYKIMNFEYKVTEYKVTEYKVTEYKVTEYKEEL